MGEARRGAAWRGCDGLILRPCEVLMMMTSEWRRGTATPPLPLITPPIVTSVAPHSVSLPGNTVLRANGLALRQPRVGYLPSALQFSRPPSAPPSLLPARPPMKSSYHREASAIRRQRKPWPAPPAGRRGALIPAACPKQCDALTLSATLWREYRRGEQESLHGLDNIHTTPSPGIHIIIVGFVSQ